MLTPGKLTTGVQNGVGRKSPSSICISACEQAVDGSRPSAGAQTFQTPWRLCGVLEASHGGCSEAIRGLTPVSRSRLDSFPLCVVSGAVRPSLPGPSRLPQPAGAGTYTEDSGVEEKGQGGEKVIGALLLDLRTGQKRKMGVITGAEQSSAFSSCPFFSFFLTGNVM